MDVQYGASFSAPYCRYLGLRPRTVFYAGLVHLGIERFRLMSYWNVHESHEGKYDFTELDWQFELAKKHNAKITLSIGLRQPRWPEVHQPDWAKQLPKDEWRAKLAKYIEETVRRYRNHPSLESWQLENEALNRNFGVDGEFDRRRLRSEMRLVRSLDSKHPICMSTSNSWGIPLRRPRPDRFGISLYRTTYTNGNYSYSILPAWFYRLRAGLIRFTTRKPVFIHELQMEPWGPGGIMDMSLKEQLRSMNANQFRENIKFARRTGLQPIDLWGLEWWYFVKSKHHQREIWDLAGKLYSGRLI